LSGAVPDADDTAGALLALAAWRASPQLKGADRARIAQAAAAGVKWLLDLQNSDGGWPTFCRGWGKLPFDRSGSDLTAHTLRALHAWRSNPSVDAKRIRAAITRGLRHLDRAQHPDGSWTPLWFGNQDHPREENPVYGTARVLMAYHDLERLEAEPARRGWRWLAAAQNSDGGWGSVGGTRGGRETGPSSVEETAVAIEALLAACAGASVQPVVATGLEWMLEAVESSNRLESSPIGFYFAKLWYYETLYPLIFTVSALGRARRRMFAPSELQPATAHLPNA
jgi:squalene-hopene/tetraprenyl-beta-curcumene cyclase